MLILLSVFQVSYECVFQTLITFKKKEQIRKLSMVGKEL